MQRERLGSRLGFILLSAGCAIGIGNVWKFPYIAGQYGGGIFVLIYLFFLIILGVPVMTMEFSLGRASQKSPARIYHELAPNDKKWRVHGYASVIGNYLLMMFYTTVAGWMLRYSIDISSGKLQGLDNIGVSNYFDGILAQPVSLFIYTAIIIIVGFIICSFSLQKGLERITKYMMIALLAIMVILAINSIFTKGGEEGLKFYLLPDFERMKNAGILNVIISAYVRTVAQRPGVNRFVSGQKIYARNEISVAFVIKKELHKSSFILILTLKDSPFTKVLVYTS